MGTRDEPPTAPKRDVAIITRAGWELKAEGLKELLEFQQWYPKTGLEHFNNNYRALLLEGQSNIFMDNYSGPNEYTMSVSVSVTALQKTIASFKVIL